MRTAGHWIAGGRPVRLVHDRQDMLTAQRISWIEERARAEGIGLAGVRLVHSRLDARVQIADFLAGIARRIASDEPGGRGDPGLTVRLRPFVGGRSVRGDAGSWSRIGPGAENAGRSAPANSGV